MMKLFVLLILVLAVVKTHCNVDSAAQEVVLTLPVDGRLVIPNNIALPLTQIVLNGGEYRTVSRSDHSFSFQDVASGIYALDVYSSLFHFPQMKIKVSAENATVSVVEYKYPGAPRATANYPITLQALAPMLYEIPKPPFSILGMLMGNPMMLLMIVTAVIAFAMPKMMANMSPEELEELKRQSAGGDPMAKLTKLMSGGAAASKDDDDDN
eukprot:gene3559-3898_t